MINACINITPINGLGMILNNKVISKSCKAFTLIELLVVMAIGFSDTGWNVIAGIIKSKKQGAGN